MKILITGASGFIGSFIVEEALNRGMETWAAVRKTSSRQYLTDDRIHFIELDLSNQQQLEEQLRGKDFDYVVHAAGITKALHAADFHKVNTVGTQNLVHALLAVGMPLRRFVYMSSLSVFGAVRESQPYNDIEETDVPVPNTAYGRSKLESEKFLKTTGGNLPYIVLRPTGVYGPRERDYYVMMKSIKHHTDFSVGYKRQDITFVYVKDVVQAVFLCLERGGNGRSYFLSDGNVYQSSEFSNLVHKALGNPWWIRIKAPLWLLKIITTVGGWWGETTGKMSVLNQDKYNILSQRNWRCDIRPAIDELGYQPHYDLRRGVEETVAWYKEHGWL